MESCFDDKKKKNNMEEKECDEFLDFIIIESTQSLNF